MALVVTNLPANAGDARDSGSILGLDRFPPEPLQYSCLENPHGQRSLAGYSPWGSKEVDTNERLSINNSAEVLSSAHKSQEAHNVLQRKCMC